MIRYVLKRIFLAAFSVFLLFTIVYFLMELNDTMPFERPSDALGIAEYEAKLASVRLDRSVAVRYGLYVRDFFTKGEPGFVYASQTMNVPETFFARLPYSMMVTVPVVLISVPLGFLLGVLTGYRARSGVDRVITASLTTLISIPAFVIVGIIIMIANQIGVPTIFISPELSGWQPTVRSLLVPVLVLALIGSVAMMHATRAELVLVLSSDYVTMARAKGMRPGAIFWRHVLKNISAPLLAKTIAAFPAFFIGNLIIERMFDIPGNSALIAAAVRDNERDLVAFNVIFFASLGMIGSILGDLTLALLDRRVRFELSAPTIIELKIYQMFQEMTLRTRVRRRLREPTNV